MSREHKAMLLDMLAWFHDFCGQNGLCYYALGGTMLGAVRHGGFIPWDDDIDVGMPRRDYARLAQLMGEQPHVYYLLETPDSEHADYVFPFSKLYDTRTTLVENTRYGTRRGIYLDIFPLDGAGDSQSDAMMHFASIKRRRNLLLVMATGVRPGRNFLKNLAVLAMRAIPARWLCPKKLLCSIDSLSCSRSFEDCRWVGNMMGAWMERELMPREILGKPAEYAFEHLTIFGPEDAEGYLTRLYGDWRKLPPREKQTPPHNIVFLDLERSYLLP